MISSLTPKHNLDSIMHSGSNASIWIYSALDGPMDVDNHNMYVFPSKDYLMFFTICGLTVNKPETRYCIGNAKLLLCSWNLIYRSVQYSIALDRDTPVHTKFGMQKGFHLELRCTDALFRNWGTPGGNIGEMCDLSSGKKWNKRYHIGAQRRSNWICIYSSGILSRPAGWLPESRAILAIGTKAVFRVVLMVSVSTFRVKFVINLQLEHFYWVSLAATVTRDWPNSKYLYLMSKFIIICNF